MKVRVSDVEKWLATAGREMMLEGNVGSRAAPQAVQVAGGNQEVIYMHQANPASPEVFMRVEIGKMWDREARNLCTVLDLTDITYPKRALCKNHFKYKLIAT